MPERIRKWQVLEGVVAAIEHALATVPGTRVIPNARVPSRGSSKNRQVDVVVEIPTGPRLLRVGIEVRDKGHPLDVTQVEQLGAKLSNLELDRRCVVARSGFTRDAEEESSRWGLELRTITEIGVPDWWLSSDLVMDSQQIELLSWKFGYDSPVLEHVRETLLLQSPDSLVLVEPAQPQIPFRTAVDNWGLAFLSSGDAPFFKNGDHFWLEIQLELPHGSVLRRGDESFPVPSSLICQWRFTVKRENLPMTAFTLAPGVYAFSTVWAAHGKQMSVITQERPDGARSFSFTVSDQAPRATTLPASSTPRVDGSPKPAGQHSFGKRGGGNSTNRRRPHCVRR